MAHKINIQEVCDECQFECRNGHSHICSKREIQACDECIIETLKSGFSLHYVDKG